MSTESDEFDKINKERMTWPAERFVEGPVIDLRTLAPDECAVANVLAGGWLIKKRPKASKS